MGDGGEQKQVEEDEVEAVVESTERSTRLSPMEKFSFEGLTRPQQLCLGE